MVPAMPTRPPAKKKPAAKRRRTPARRPGAKRSGRPLITYLAAGAAIVFVAGLSVGNLIDRGGPPQARVVGDVTAKAPLPPAPGGSSVETGATHAAPVP